MFKLASSGLRITSSFFPNNQSQGGFPPSACLMFTAVVLTWQHPRGADVCVHIDVLQQLYNWDNAGAYSGTSIFSLTSLADVAPLTLDLEMKAKMDTNMVASAHHMVPGKQTVSEWCLISPPLGWKEPTFLRWPLQFFLHQISQEMLWFDVVNQQTIRFGNDAYRTWASYFIVP